MSEIQTLTEQTADRLIDFIIKNECTEGSKLPNEAELCELFGISRTTLREAVRMLASRNILEVRQGSGIFICKNTGISDDPLGLLFIRDKKKLAADLLEFRMLIEPRIAADAARNATVEQADELSRLASLVEERYKAGEPHSAEDGMFHAKLGELSGNLVYPNLKPIIFCAIDLFIGLTNAELKDETIKTHRAIADAVRRHDPIAAKDAMYLHLVCNRICLTQTHLIPEGENQTVP